MFYSDKFLLFKNYGLIQFLWWKVVESQNYWISTPRHWCMWGNLWPRTCTYHPSRGSGYHQWSRAPLCFCFCCCCFCVGVCVCVCRCCLFSFLCLLPFFYDYFVQFAILSYGPKHMTNLHSCFPLSPPPLPHPPLPHPTPISTSDDMMKSLDAFSPLTCCFVHTNPNAQQ